MMKKQDAGERLTMARALSHRDLSSASKRVKADAYGRALVKAASKDFSTIFTRSAHEEAKPPSQTLTEVSSKQTKSLLKAKKMPFVPRINMAVAPGAMPTAAQVKEAERIAAQLRADNDSVDKKVSDALSVSEREMMDRHEMHKMALDQGGGLNLYGASKPHEQWKYMWNARSDEE